MRVQNLDKLSITYSSTMSGDDRHDCLHEYSYIADSYLL